MEVNWVVTIAIGALISIPVGFLVNLLTPRLQNRLSRNSVNIRNRNLSKLRARLARLETYAQDKSALFLDIVDIFAVALILLIGGLACFGLAALFFVSVEVMGIPLLGVMQSGDFSSVFSVLISLCFALAALALWCWALFEISKIDVITYKNIPAAIARLNARIGSLANGKKE